MINLDGSVGVWFIKTVFGVDWIYQILMLFTLKQNQNYWRLI